VEKELEQIGSAYQKNPAQVGDFEFTYRNGHIPYRVLMIEGSWVVLSALVFADMSSEVKGIVLRMAKAIQAEILNNGSKYLNQHEDVQLFYRTELNKMKIIIENIDKLQVSMADTNRFYKIGWASNDTL